MMPHFTIVSPKANIQKSNLQQALYAQAGHIKNISFTLKEAIFMPPIGPYSSWYVFLLPENGFSHISQLYRKFHANDLKNYINTEFPYIPHITVGKFSNKKECLKLTNKLNNLDLNIAGIIKKIQLLEIIDSEICLSDEIDLE